MLHRVISKGINAVSPSDSMQRTCPVIKMSQCKSSYNSSIDAGRDEDSFCSTNIFRLSRNLCIRFSSNCANRGKESSGACLPKFPTIYIKRLLLLPLSNRDNKIHFERIDYNIIYQLFVIDP